MNPRAFWPCIDSNATDTFNAQKGSKDIDKIGQWFKKALDFIKNILICVPKMNKGFMCLEQHEVINERI